MYPAHVADAELHQMRGVALHEPSKTVSDADYPQSAIDRFDGGRSDNTVDSRSRAPADKDSQLRALTWFIHAVYSSPSRPKHPLTMFRGYVLCCHDLRPRESS